MCNDHANRTPFSAYGEAFSPTRTPLVFPGPEQAPNLEPRDDIRPTEDAPVIRPVGTGCELAPLRWEFRPARPKAPVVINFRSEGRRFGRGRRLVPVYHDRQAAVLERGDRDAWLTAEDGAEALLRPPPAGTFAVEAVEQTGAPA